MTEQEWRLEWVRRIAVATAFVLIAVGGTAFVWMVEQPGSSSGGTTTTSVVGHPQP